MGWIAGPVLQDPKSTWRWDIFNFSMEPGGVVVTAEALGMGTEITSTNSGCRQPTLAEEQSSRNPHKTYRLDVTNEQASPASFWIIGVS